MLEIVLDRPPVNAIDQVTADALYGAFCELRDDAGLAVGVFRGVGRLFSAGWDLKAAAASVDPAAVGQTPGGFGGLTELWSLTKPVIAAVNGRAVGGGFELLLACDLVLAVPEAEFWLPEVTIGVLPDGGALQWLPRRLPLNVASDLILTARRMPADEALRWGLVREIVPADRLATAALDLAAAIAEAAPLSLRAAKAVLRETAHLPVTEVFARLRPGASGIEAYERVYASADFLEGPAAFAEGRPPVWTGDA